MPTSRRCGDRRAGGVFYAADRLDQPWRTLTRADPLYYLVDATRQGWAGVHEASVAASLLVALAVAGGVFSLAVALVGRGWRLKP
jgi:ABC-2 type transport system permease protein